MLKTIYQYEIKYWLKQPATYVYASIIFFISFVTMMGMAGEPPVRFNERIVNSPIFLLMLTKKFMLLAFLLLPAVIGVSIYRDFNTQMHSILYSYPFSKRAYLGGKFLSGLTVFSAIIAMLGIGYLLGLQMPWVDGSLIQPFDYRTYLQLYGVILLPNVWIVSTLVFGVVLWSRNIYSGFIAILFLLLIPILASYFFKGTVDRQFWAALFDPMGIKSIDFYTKNWTVAEQNELLLPIQGVVIYNRLLWLSISFLGLGMIYKTFQFHQTATDFSILKIIKSLFDKNRKAPTVTSSSNKNPSQLGNITKVHLSKITLNYSWFQQLKNVWHLSAFEFRYLFFSKTFLSLLLGGMVLVLLFMSAVNPRGETETLPMTWQMLELPSQFYSGFINLVTFLYAGLLVHRSKMAKTHFLVDATPVSNWVLLGSKLLALVKIQAVLLSLIMIGGIAAQAYRGYYHFEIGQYVFNLFGMNLIHFVIWAMLALFVQNLLNNPYLGFFLLLFMPVGFIGLSEFGPQFLGLQFLEQLQFRYNQAPGEVFGLRYSDMDGYGPDLVPYFIYKLYWTIAGIVLLFGALLMMRRGLPQSFKERLQIAKQRFSGRLALGLLTCLGVFLSMGFAIYYENNIANTTFSRVEKRTIFNAADDKYRHFENKPQPKIVAVKINMDLFPSQRQYEASGEYILINKTEKVIDTLLVTYFPDLRTTFEFDQKNTTITKDKIANIAHFDIVLLANGLAPKDTLKMTFKNHNNPMGWIQTNQYVKEQGTYLTDNLFPRFGNWFSFFRAEYGMGKDNERPLPSDTTVLSQSFMSKDADRIDFEAIVSTEKGQIALSPGKLIKEWTAKERPHYHYKTKEKIGVSYLFSSGEFEVVKDKWKDIDLEIYYDKDHPYNIDRMMQGMKDGLAYCTENFSPYQFKEIRMMEYAGGHSAHAFPNTIPASEGAGFIAAVDDSEEGGVDFPYGMAVHEVAHQWWGHQVLPADVRGSKMVTESTAEYVNVMVKKKELGIAKVRQFLNVCLEMYLKERRRDRRGEEPLMLAYPDQNYIHYTKGAMVFYALSDYIGEGRLNAALKKYVDKVAFQEGEYTTSLELVDYLKIAIPDSLQYLITDMFETVTLYDNKMVDWESSPLANGKYEVKMHVQVSKYRSGQQGKRIFSDNGLDSLILKMPEKELVVSSLPLADYIELGVFGADKKELHLGKYRIDNIENTISIIVNEKPLEVAIDPYFLLIDREIGDNWIKG